MIGSAHAMREAGRNKQYERKVEEGMKKWKWSSVSAVICIV